MGCDIHIFLEYKVGDGPWQADKNHKMFKEGKGYQHLEQFPFTKRHYDIFGKLAGVRTTGPEAKGFPEDVSEIIQSDAKEYGEHYEYGDFHSHSYCSLAEYKVALLECGIQLEKIEKEIVWDSWYSYDYDLRYEYGVAYIEQQAVKLKVDIEAEKHLLGQDINTNVEARLVFWFDN